MKLKSVLWTIYVLIVLAGVAFMLSGCGFSKAAKRMADTCEPIKYEVSYKAKRLSVECK
jgi:hypothetical protein